MRSGVIGCDRNGAVSAALCANHGGTNRRTLRNSTHTCEVWGRCPAPPAAAAPDVRCGPRGRGARGWCVERPSRTAAYTRYLDMRTPIAPIGTHDTTSIPIVDDGRPRRRGDPGGAGGDRLIVRLRAERRALATSPLRSKLKKTL